jgi:hypothetical protein
MSGAPRALARESPAAAEERAAAATSGGRRELLGRAAPYLLVLLLALALPADQGGYFPTAWGWSSLALLWLLALWAIMARRWEVARLDLALLALFAALLAWTVLSLLWSVAPGQTALEVERSLLYLAAVAAFLLLVRQQALAALAGSVLAALTAVAGYGLVTRLFPDRLGVYDPVAVYRLSEPIGYWNGLGIVAAMAAVLALGLAAQARSTLARAGAAAALPFLLPTLYFTYSRAAWIALALGLLAALVVTPQRLRLRATALAASPAPAAAVWLCARSGALTRQGSPLAEATRAGHRLAALLLALALAGALALALLAALERRLRPGLRLRRAFASLALLLAAAALAALFARYGSPPALAEKGYRAFTAPPPQIGPDLNERLFSLSGNGRADLWQVAWRQYRAHPWLGAGAGSYERFWLSDQRSTFKVRDAHGLYLETLAELGPPGLALLLAGLALPLLAGWRARRHPFVPALLGAYTVFLLHAGVDWDWELAGVTASALLLAVLLTASARPARPARPVPTPARAALLALLVPLAFVALAGSIGNGALAAAEDAVAAKRWREAELQARRAEPWMPWSAQPLVLRGQAELGAGRLAAARASFRRAVARDAGNWQAWLGLALVSHGRERQAAVARASTLNRHHPAILRLQGGREVRGSTSSLPTRTVRRK